MEIKKPGYKELDVFVTSIGGLNTIPKTMKLVDSINKEIALMKYLRIKRPDNLKDKVDQII